MIVSTPILPSTGTKRQLSHEYHHTSMFFLDQGLCLILNTEGISITHLHGKNNLVSYNKLVLFKPSLKAAFLNPGPQGPPALHI